MTQGQLWIQTGRVRNKMIDKAYLKNHLQKYEELEAMMIRYNFLVISSPAGKTDLPAENFAFSAVESLVYKKIDMERKIKELTEELTQQSKLINDVFEKLQNPYEKLVMQMRYTDGFEWDKIRGEIFGSRKDYSVNTEKYSNKVFKIHGAALEHIKELQKE